MYVVFNCQYSSYSDSSPLIDSIRFPFWPLWQGLIPIWIYSTYDISNGAINMSSQSIPHVIDTRIHTVLPRTMLLVLTDQVPSLSLTIVFPVSLVNICRYLIPTITTVLLSSVNSYTWIPVVSFWFLLCRITPLFRPFLMTSLITVMLSS